MTGPSFVFNRVTFALPIQSFKVTAFISTEQRLPAVTEFVLRLLHTCGQISVSGFRAYFGFSDAEALSVIESMDRQGYVRLTDDALLLSEQMHARFQASPDDYPWVTKLKKRSHVVPFDLLAFTALRRADFAMASDNWIKLNPSEDIVGNSIARTRRAYRESFSGIEREDARGRGEVRERSYGVHSIENVEARRTGFIPVTLSLGFDEAGHLSIEPPSEFERGAKVELLQAFQERVADEFEKNDVASGSSEVEEFLELFKLDFLRQYVTGKNFDLARYAKDVKQGLAAPHGVQPLFGSLYLQQNSEVIDTALVKARSGGKGAQRRLNSLAWVAPNYSFWGRGEDFRRTVEQLTNSLKVGGEDDLCVFDFAEERQEPTVRARYFNTGLKELHLLRPGGQPNVSWAQMLELVLYPCDFAVAMLHLPVDGSPGIKASVGVLTRTSPHLHLVHRLILDKASGNRYAGCWSVKRFSAKDRPRRNFAETCGFLHYSDCAASVGGKTSL